MFEVLNSDHMDLDPRIYIAITDHDILQSFFVAFLINWTFSVVGSQNVILNEGANFFCIHNYLRQRQGK